MKRTLTAAAFCAALLASASSFATGLATCDSGPRETWQPQEKLEKMLVEKGYDPTMGARPLRRGMPCPSINAVCNCHEVTPVLLTSMRKAQPRLLTLSGKPSKTKLPML